MYSEIIGVIGMGSYATAHFFKRLLDAFPAEKEWDRPQIIVNNNCTMPSRVRAILYGEKVEQLKNEFAECARGILRCAGGKRVKLVVDCNTIHHYMEDVTKIVPEAEFIDIIECCAVGLVSRGIKQISVLASEGVFDTKLYDRYMQQYGISVDYPVGKMKEIRYFIECVKQNGISDEAKEKFYALLSSIQCQHIVLGCTELPVIFDSLSEKEKNSFAGIHDPLEYVIEKLKLELR